MITDPIGDFLTRIRNAQMAGRTEIEMPYSKEKEKIASVMKKNGFLQGVKKGASDKFAVLQLELADKKLSLKRVSRPGQRIYTKAAEIRKVLNGFGITVVSTSKGIMSGYEARSLNIGGEVLCEIS